MSESAEWSSGETLAVGPAPRPRRRWVPWVAAGSAIAVVLLAVGLLAADWAARTAELRTLLAAVETSEAGMVAVQDEVSAAFDAFEADGETAEARTALDTDLRDAAAGGAVAIETAGDRVAAVGLLPWHGDLLRARDAYLLHNQAWVDYLQRAQDEPAEFVREQVDVNRTFLEAEPLFREAVPWPPLPVLVERIDVIFAEPEPEPGSVESTSMVGLGSGGHGSR